MPTNDATSKPQWGLFPSTEDFAEWWGCRAIIHPNPDGYVDFVHDRQSYQRGCRHSNMKERKEDPEHAWECADCGYVYGLDPELTPEFKRHLDGNRGLMGRINMKGLNLADREASEWNEVLDADSSVIVVQLKRSGDYLLCGVTRRAPSFGRRVADALLALGIDATHEYPGYVSIAITPALGWNFGTVNGIWEGDLVAQGEVIGHAHCWHLWGGVPMPIPSTAIKTPEEVAQAINDSIEPRIWMTDEANQTVYAMRRDEMKEIIPILGWGCVIGDRCRGLNDLDREIIRRLRQLPSLPIPERPGVWLDRHHMASAAAAETHIETFGMNIGGPRPDLGQKPLEK